MKVKTQVKAGERSPLRQTGESPMTLRMRFLAGTLVTILGGMFALPSSVEAGGNKPIKLNALKKVETIAPITVVYNRAKAAGSQESSPDLAVAADIKFLKRAPLSEEESAFYDSFTREMLDSFERQTGKRIVEMDTELVADLPQEEYDTKYVVMAPYLHFDREDPQTIARACKRLGVDAVALFSFKYRKYKKSMGFGPALIGSAKTKYKLKCDLFIVDKSGKTLVKGEIDSERVIGKKGHTFGMMIETGEFNPEFYSQLRAAWFERFEGAFK